MIPQLPAPNAGLGIALLFVTLLASALAGLSPFALIRAGIFYSLYTWLFARVTELTGLDLRASRAITLAVLVVLWCLPWQLLIIPWAGNAMRQVMKLAPLAVLALAAMTLATRDVYFSRTDGKALKFYIRTLDGYKLAAAPGTDPIFGIPYQPITAEVAKNYLLWKRRGGRMQDPFVPKSQYFNPSTGEPVRLVRAASQRQARSFSRYRVSILSTVCGSPRQPWKPSKNTRSNEPGKSSKGWPKPKPRGT